MSEARSDSDTPEGNRGRREPERKDDPLADAVGEKAPRQEGGCHPDPERRQRDSGLAEAETELLPELGREHGDADRRRGHGCLCCRSDG